MAGKGMPPGQRSVGAGVEPLKNFEPHLDGDDAHNRPSAPSPVTLGSGSGLFIGTIIG